MLKNVDAKKNRYTVQVMADDKLTEKKDKKRTVLVRSAIKQL